MAPFTRIVFILVSVLLMIPEVGHSQSEDEDGVAAIVNDKVITISEAKKRIESLVRSIEESTEGAERKKRVREARLNALKSLIDKELIIQDFNKKQFFIPQSFIDDRLKDVVRSQFDGDRTAFTKTIQADGISLQQYKEDLKETMIVQAMRDHNVTRAVIISPFKIEKYYQENVKEFTQEEQVRVSIIFLRKNLEKEKRKNEKGEEIEYDPAEDRAKEILLRLDSGADFAELARAESVGEYREKGGDWGWVNRNGFAPELVQEISKLQPGQISRIVTTEDGYYIIRLDDTHRARVQPMNEVRDQIERTLIQQERERIQQDWLDGLRTKAYIKMF